MATGRRVTMSRRAPASRLSIVGDKAGRRRAAARIVTSGLSCHSLAPRFCVGMARRFSRRGWPPQPGDCWPVNSWSSDYVPQPSVTTSAPAF